MLSTAADSMRGRLYGADAAFAGVSTDTRTLSAGELFFALSGPNFDGNDFVGQACAKGAAGAVVTRIADDPIAQIEVPDARRALGLLAAAWRDRQPATVIGITGSNGKTTLKELVAACLSRIAPTLATAGNLNNDIGVPLMLLRIAPEHRYAVIEMGANRAGEIAYLTALARPSVVAITNAGTAHLEGFGSVELVARAKGEILDGTPRPDVAVLNADDDYYEYWRSRARDVRILSFGLAAGADVRASGISTARGATVFDLHLPAADVHVELPLAGQHNVRNACAAAAIATALGVDPAAIVAGLQAVRPVSGRLEPVPGRHGATLYDDSYNANPGSVIAAAEFLVSLGGRSCFVLGDMYELGPDAEELHRGVGAALRECGIDRLLALGELSKAAARAFGAGGEWFGSVEELVASLDRELSADVNVLVKGSRGMRMERVVAGLRAPAPESGEV
jgi:UDP-N-acetylmuramoyl-tripeptide--D-alanyl-D-alanine ligase